MNIGPIDRNEPTPSLHVGQSKEAKGLPHSVEAKLYKILEELQSMTNNQNATPSKIQSVQSQLNNLGVTLNSTAEMVLQVSLQNLQNAYVADTQSHPNAQQVYNSLNDAIQGVQTLLS